MQVCILNNLICVHDVLNQRIHAQWQILNTNKSIIYFSAQMSTTPRLDPIDASEDQGFW